MEFLKDYLVLAVMGVCVCVGYIIKNVIPADVVNRFIPLIMGVLGVLLNVWFSGWAFTPEILLGGLASGLASTGGYELVKNLIRKFGGDKDGE